MKLFDITNSSFLSDYKANTLTEEQQHILTALSSVNLLALTVNLILMVYVFSRYIYGLSIKNKMVRLFYFLAFCMTIMYMIFQIDMLVVGPDGSYVVSKNVFNVRNASLSIAKIFDLMLSL